MEERKDKKRCRSTVKKKNGGDVIEATQKAQAIDPTSVAQSQLEFKQEAK